VNQSIRETFITILSIDCGEVRNIISSEVPSVLESKLQVNLFSQHACLYFPLLMLYTKELYIGSLVSLLFYK